VKHQTHCLKYEIAVHLSKGIAVSISGPHLGATHDITIARSAFIFNVGDDETVTGDKAYIGENCFITPFRPSRTLHQNIFNRKLASLHSAVECYNRRVKIFDLFDTDFTGNLNEHSGYFFAVCNIINLEMVLGM